jgi:DNA mismatch repair protein MutS
LDRKNQKLIQQTLNKRWLSLYYSLNNSISNSEIINFWEDFFLFETYWSITKGIILKNFKFPTFSNDFIIENFYHPFINEPIKNTVQVNENIVIITGPNMSGKSSMLKSIGLCMYLAHLGIGVPASKCTIPYFNSISIKINSRDDLKNKASHLTTEIHLLKMILSDIKSGNRCFALFDELFTGTNPEEAKSLFLETVNGLRAIKNSYFLISTHLLSINELLLLKKSSNIAMYNFDCSFNLGQLMFSYQLNKGWSNTRIGKILYDKAGIPELLNSLIAIDK